MIDPRILRTAPERLRESQLRRGLPEGTVIELEKLDAEHREALHKYEELRSQQKRLSKDIGKLKGRIKKSGSKERPVLEQESESLLASAGELAEAVKVAEQRADRLGAEVEDAWLTIDNLVDPQAPVGDEDAFRVITEVGTPRDFGAEGFTPLDHLQLGEAIGAIDVERAAKVSGSRFYYLVGDGALLELALLNLAMNLAHKNGLRPVLPPALVKPAAMAGTGFLGQAAENVYHLADDDMYLVGTAEVPLASMHADEILDRSALPLRYVGYSPCFRREAGSHGKDTRGIIRVHQFDKVEMFTFCEPEEAEREHSKLLGWEREFMDRLELPYRVIDVATGDLGASAARKFDIEAWIPTQGRYREVTSTSNCTTFQSRRLAIRYRDEEGRVAPVATLNGTLVAMPRVIVALLENHQTADGRVAIPKALRPFLSDRAYLTPLQQQ
ncbi:MAG: serine--tRNA ligase [Actinobacteria bacterium]|nr:serine--tRNA ligase [Actinomycetota bacterium]